MWYGMGVPRVQREDMVTVSQFLFWMHYRGATCPVNVTEARWDAMLRWFQRRYTNDDWIIDEETGERY